MTSNQLGNDKSLNKTLTVIGMAAGVLVGFLVGKKKYGLRSNADATLFVSNAGNDGFCTAKILKNRMKGRAFRWQRVGMCQPTGGGYFEIRMKSGSSPLIPPQPQGVNDIYADVHDWAEAGDVYSYSMWQVLADGRERELHDPELEIGQI